MSLPVIAITNASTCLQDQQVEAVIPTLRRKSGGKANRTEQEAQSPSIALG